MIAKGYAQERSVVDEYCKGILDDTIPAGRLVKLAVRRHIQDLENAHERGLHFDEHKAAEACQFFPAVLRHSKGEWAGKPFEITPSQAFVTWCVYGWQREDATRRFTRSLVEVARKFGKSEFGSGVAIKHTAFDNPCEPGAEVFLAATKEDQVRDTTFKQCVRMVNASPSLKQRMKALKKSITVSEMDPFQPNSVLKPIGSDSDTSDGFDLSAAILDELHAWKKYHLGFYERMTTAGGSRRQELIWFFTTAGDEKSELWIKIREQFVRALESVETGVVTADHLFAFIACIDEADDPLELDVDDEAFYRIMAKANPNYPITPKKKYLRERAIEAKSNPLERNKFMRFHANVMTSLSVKPFPASRWVPQMKKHSKPIGDIYGAFDLGRSDDFAAWALLWNEGDFIKFKVRSYTCKERPESLQTTEIQSFIDAGHLIEHPGNQVDFDVIKDEMIAASREHDVIKWAFDEQFAKVIAQQMQNELGESSVEKFVQSPRYYNEPCRRFLKEFNAGNVIPDDDSCLQWQAKNVSFKPNAKDEYMPDKGIGQEYKIDAMVCVFMGYAQCLFVEPEEVLDYYDTHEVEIV